MQHSLTTDLECSHSILNRSLRILLINQAFVPDTVSTAQHAADLVSELAERGHAVTVIASQRSYDDPQTRFEPQELWRGVHIHRVRCSGFGKTAAWRRTLDFGTFLVSCALRLILLPRSDIVIAMTSPPLLSLVPALFRWKARDRVLWVMDLNPDEAIAAGWIRPGSVAARVLNSMSRFSIKACRRVIVLDHFMKERLIAKGASETQLTVVPPWSHNDDIEYTVEGRKRFRDQHGLVNRFVVMYSGNHSPCHPLDTLLGAASQLSDCTEIAFCFIGGGSEFKRVKLFAQRNHLSNIICLPYQPLEVLSASLSAADLHVVVLGDPFVGIVHPCKVYNILALGIPFVYIGPTKSHVVDLTPPDAIGQWAFFAQHGDINTVAQCIRQQAAHGLSRSNSEICIAEAFSSQNLIPKFLQSLESIDPSESVRVARVSAP